MPVRESSRESTRTDSPAPESASQALERARRHGRRAVAEALAALQALVDAATLGWSGMPREAQFALRSLSSLLDEQSQAFRDGGGDVPMPVMTAILDALDQEIGRWEKRASRDPDARAVLRTFLGLREILWEFGFRRHGTAAPGSQEPEAPKSPRKKSPRRRRATSPAGTEKAGAAKAGAAKAGTEKAGTKTAGTEDDAKSEDPVPLRRSRVQRVDVQG